MKITQACEICYKEPADTLTHNHEDNMWYFTCPNCLKDGYWIPFKRLGELDWEEHVVGKTWVVAAYFVPKLRWAVKCYNQKKGKHE